MKPSLIQRLRDRTLPPICNEAADKLIDLEVQVRDYDKKYGEVMDLLTQYHQVSKTILELVNNDTK